MFNQTNKQFNYATRYQRVGLGKDDITKLEGVVRKVQAGDMEESGKVGDYTFTFWFVPFSKPGCVLRCCAMGMLAERLQKTEAEDVVSISGNIISGLRPWVKLSDTEIIKVRGTGEEL